MAQEIEWGDPDTGKQFGERGSRYKGRVGFKDMIRIVTKPIKYFRHKLPFHPYGANCNMDEGKCLFCEKHYEKVLTVGCIVCHIAEKGPGDKDYRNVGKTKIWTFGRDKWQMLEGIAEDYPQIRRDGIKMYDLIVSLKDAKEADKFQKLEIRPTLVDTKMEKQMLADYGSVLKGLKAFTSGMPIEKQKEIYAKEFGEDTDDVGEENKKAPAAESKKEEGLGDLLDGIDDKKAAKKDDVDDILKGLGEDN